MPWTVNSEIYPLWARSTGNACSSGINWIFNVLVSLTFLHTAEYLTYYGKRIFFPAIVSFLFFLLFLDMLSFVIEKTRWLYFCCYKYLCVAFLFPKVLGNGPGKKEEEFSLPEQHCFLSLSASQPSPTHPLSQPKHFPAISPVGNLHSRAVSLMKKHKQQRMVERGRQEVQG